MTGDCHVPFRGSPGVRFPRATRQPSALPCQQLLIRHHTLCGVMRKLRARMADMGTACYVCAWPVLKRRVGDLEHLHWGWT
jgi:hypothetical protein